MQEELIEIQRAKNDDKEAIERLLNKYNYLIQAKVSKFYVQGMEKEDLKQEASIAFLDAIKVFDSNKNDKFSSFVSLCIERKLISILTSSQRQKNIALNTSISLNNSIFTNDENNLFFLDIIENEEDTTEEKIIKQEKLKNLKKQAKQVLSDFEQLVLEKYLKGFSYSEMAKIFNTNTKAIDNAIQRIRNKLKKQKLL